VNAELPDFDTDHGLVFQAYQGFEGLARLTPGWTELAESLPAAGFVHFPEWYRAYLSSLESDPRRVWFIGAFRRQKLVGVFPLQFQAYQVRGLRPNLFGTIDNDEMQLSDFVFAQTPENASLLSDLTRWLRAQRTIRWDELRLRKVPEDSAIAHSARAQLPKGTVALQHDGSCYFQTAGSYEQATAAMSGTFKRNLRRLARRAEGSAPLRHQSCRRPDELAAAFETFIDIEASGWKGDSGKSSAIRCRPPMLAFYRTLVREFGARNACVINLLWHGEQAVAGQFCLQIGRTLSILKIGFSHAHGDFAPGNLLLERTIRRACDDRELDVVSLVNRPPWARNFKPLTTGVWSYCTPNWHARGVLVHLALLAKRTLDARARKPALAGATDATSDAEVAM
jgi:CelD/BcsL family acetyltransferase involved in cellulose biosynthesis